MGRIKQLAAGLTLLLAANSYAKDKPQLVDTKIQNLLTAHYEKYSSQEYFSGITLSYYTPERSIKSFYTGTVSQAPDSKKIDGNTLFQIGSITKSFTAAVMLQLDKEGKLDITSSIKDWLPDYSKWSSVELTQLLNMSSGLPNYSDTPLWNAREFKDPGRAWTNKELIAFVYPSGPLSPPLKTDYFYTNTGYILADLIIEKSDAKSFKTELKNRTIKLADLKNTFYPVPTMSPETIKRMASGYNYNQYDNPALVGKDMSTNNLSWAAAAGGIVSTSEDIVKWVKALFIDDKILGLKQKEKLTQLVSLESCKKIKETTESDPRGFGLGVTQTYSKDPDIGRFWFYEGETLGYRAIYMYTPCNNVIISSIFNSATNSENDHSKELMQNTYKLLLAQNPKLSCQPAKPAARNTSE